MRWSWSKYSDDVFSYSILPSSDWSGYLERIAWALYWGCRRRCQVWTCKENISDLATDVLRSKVSSPDRGILAPDKGIFDPDQSIFALDKSIYSGARHPCFRPRWNLAPEYSTQPCRPVLPDCNETNRTRPTRATSRCRTEMCCRISSWKGGIKDWGKGIGAF